MKEKKLREGGEASASTSLTPYYISGACFSLFIARSSSLDAIVIA